MIVLTVALVLGSFAQPALALSDKDKARIAGAVLGIAIANKIKKERGENSRYERRNDYYVARYYKGDPIYCYPRTRSCYWHGRFSPRTTHQEFGYR